MKPSRIIVLAAMLFGLAACAPRNVSTSSYYSSATTYMNDEGDGSITVRAYGQGRNHGDAIEQARKNAVRDVIFKGVNVPGNALLSKPLVTGVNAEEKYQSFFGAFFTDGGMYQQFASSEDRRGGSTKRQANTMQVKFATTVRVKRSELRQYLIDNGIIKP